ncbi:MAG: AMP-binding protein, partial [Crocinitomicaceae bacterium]|nr:AMP-binding protein [Crocinitomicaceae bacterium]
MIPTNFEEYQKAYHASINNPELFWGDFAKREFDWNKPWDNVLSGDMASGNVKWFEGAELNITENCIDRHLAKKGNQTAIIFEANDPKEKALHISYNDLSKNVNKTANMLKSMGAKKGDRICIYMPMVPELAYAVLACARIGAIHSVVFAGFSAKSLSDRINDGTCNILLTADAGFRGTKVTELKSIADEALEVCPTIKKVIVLNRTNTKIDMKLVRDHWWHEEFSKASTDCEAEIMNAE